MELLFSAGTVRSLVRLLIIRNFAFLIVLYLEVSFLERKCFELFNSSFLLFAEAVRRIIFEVKQAGEAMNVKTLTDGPSAFVSAVNSCNVQFFFVCVVKLFPIRSKFPAVSTPRRVELDKPAFAISSFQSVRINNLLIEFRQRQNRHLRSRLLSYT